MTESILKKKICYLSISTALAFLMEVAISQIFPLIMILQIMKIVWVHNGFNKIYNLRDGHKNILPVFQQLFFLLAKILCILCFFEKYNTNH